MLPAQETLQTAVAEVFAILRNASVAFGAPYRNFGVYDTEYRTVCDLSGLRYFFELSRSPSIIWVDLNVVDLTEVPMMSFDPYDGMPAGDISSQFMAPASVLY